MNKKNSVDVASLPAKWRGTNGADLPPYHADIGGCANNGRFYLDKCADELEAALASPAPRAGVVTTPSEVCGAPRDGRACYPDCACDTERDCDYGTVPAAPSVPPAYDRELIARMLESVVAGTVYGRDAVIEQIRLLREADNAEAAGIRTVDRSTSVAGDAGELGWPTDLGWPDKPFTVHDEPGEHDPCWLVMPGGESIALNHHAINGVDQARAHFIADACNARRLAAAEQPGSAVQGEAALRGKYGDVLRPFVVAMEAELHANAGKGDRPGWLAMSPQTALLEIYYHLGKLQRAVKKEGGDLIREYAADVANMSMMLLDICGGLALIEDTTPPPAPAAKDRIEAMRGALDKAAKAVSGPEAPMPTVLELAARLRQKTAPAAEQGEVASCGCNLDYRGQHITVCPERPLAFGLHDPAAAFNQAQPEARGVEGMVLVPENPTQPMRDAGNKAIRMCETEPGMGMADRAFYAYIAMIDATPNPVRAEQPEGKGAWDASFRSDAMDYANKLRTLAESQPGTVIAGVVALLDDISKLPDPFASAPAAPGAAVDDAMVERAYMAWKRAAPNGVKSALSAALTAAFAGKEGA